MPRFTVLRDGRIERSLTLLTDEVSIGRLPAADIVLASPSVSRRHARIRREHGRFVVEDVGSMNGVHVDGRRVRRHELATGDRIAIEGYEIVFEPDAALYSAGLHPDSGRAREQEAYGMTFLSARGLTTTARLDRR